MSVLLQSGVCDAFTHLAINFPHWQMLHATEVRTVGPVLIAINCESRVRVEHAKNLNAIMCYVLCTRILCYTQITQLLNTQFTFKRKKHNDSAKTSHTVSLASYPRSFPACAYFLTHAGKALGTRLRYPGCGSNCNSL